ncbi:flagellar hook-associated protein FlgK [Sneathiella chinensis]|uniref:Flagellar hook-associated protein 1 n=1 Tax=Sneathiella chinensis TaxID=349750 RepID=A0ABQ5U374_9PROT|nr:flagellar hook-associated protein FlgK [Sneathiella chinensis]GLQ05856.1 flagellar hook-associated protein FlgK [Sneathiella chinensis]
MSLNAIMNAGVTGMLSHQKALNVTSSNIANVHTDGYARKVVDYGSVALHGVGAGVEIEDIRRVTDQFILKELRLSTANTEQYKAMSEIHIKLQSLLGDPAANTSLTGKLDSIHASFASLTADPTLTVSRTAALNELQNFGIETNRLQSHIQDLRKEADSKIKGDIETVNQAILRVSKLNDEIIAANISEQPTGELEDQRDQAIMEIAKIMDVKTYPQGNGALAIVTKAGQQLLDFTPRQLVYNEAATVTSETVFSQVTLNLYDKVHGTVAPTGLPLDPELSSGSLRGWLDMRNIELPALADQIGALAGGVAEQFNAIHNANISVPPPASMTGRNTGVVAGEPHGFTGQATFYSFDANNEIVASYTVDFDNPGTLTMTDVMNEVNAALGAGTLTLTNGVLGMSAQGGATGVGIEQDAVSPADRGGRGFSHFFGMNDLIETEVETAFSTGLGVGDAHNFTGTTELEFRGPDGQVVSNFTVDFGAIGGTVGDVLNELNTNLSPYATASLNAKGELQIKNALGYENHKVLVKNDTSDRGATGMNFPDMFGIGLKYPSEMGVNFSVRDDIVGDPMKLALAHVDPAGSPALTLADNRGALDFQALSSAVYTFKSAGNLTGSTVTVAEYAAQVLANAGLGAARAESLQSDRAALTGVLSSRMMEKVGVNMDEELANLIVYQNAYNAAARVITTARDMYDILLNIA